MKGLMAYGLTKASRTTQEESDNMHEPPADTRDTELEDLEELNQGNEAVSSPNDYLGWQRPFGWDTGWMRPQRGSRTPGYSFETVPQMPQPNTPYGKTLEHVYGEPAKTSLGVGGGTGYYDNNMFFNSTTGKYEKNLSTRSDMMPSPHHLNRHYQMAQKPHLKFDKATGKYFNPSNGAPGSPAYSGLVPGTVNDSQGNPVNIQRAYVKNPVFTRAVDNYNTRNDRNSAFGKSVNDRLSRLNNPDMYAAKQYAQRVTGKPRPSPTPAMQTQKAMSRSSAP